MIFLDNEAEISIFQWWRGVAMSVYSCVRKLSNESVKVIEE